jgi:ferric-dicitrate binding protein FerR (iron transport regulator)
VTSQRPQFKLALNVLLGSGALACTCAAYDVDVVHFWGTLLQVVGLRHPFPTREVVVGSGQELTVSGRTFTLRDVPAETVAQRLAWAGIRLRDGWVAFQGQTLESVVEEFNHHNARQLVIGDVAIRQLRIGGKFRVTDIDGFLAALAVTHGVRALRSPPGGNPDIIVLVRSASGSAYPEDATGWPPRPAG